MKYMFVNKPEFAEPIRVLFLCGSKFSNHESDKRIVLKNYLESDPRNRIILLEQYFDFPLKRSKDKGLLSYYSADLFNLYNIESFAALVATNIIIIHETLSTAGEIGVFASNEEVRDRIITLVPDVFSVEENKISGFLRLAFWNDREKLLNNQVIKFFPSTNRTMVSETHSYYATSFQDNLLPRTLGKEIENQLVKNPTACVAAIVSNNYQFNKGVLSVGLTYASIKNYLLALLSVREIRSKIRKCTKLYEIRNILNKEFSKAIINAYYDSYGVVPKTIKLYIEKQPSYEFEDVLNFMIYFWHACKIMKIEGKENDTIAVSFSKDISFLWRRYSELIKQVSFSKWGD